MYTSYIGNKFLKIYRNKKKLSDDYTARQFFDEILFPLFFDDNEHLMHVHGSSFFQKVSLKSLVNGKTKQQFQLERLHKDIVDKKISASTYVGYAAEKTQATTSGQVTSFKNEVSSEEMYASWIGQALAVGVSGGLAIQIDDEKVLWELYKGWEYYRSYLSQTPNLKDKQIETWNGHWLSHVFGEDYYSDNPLAEFNPKPEKVIGKLAIPTIDWVKVIFALSRQYPNQIMTVYIYNLSQTNTTLGFINIILPEVGSLLRLKEQLYKLSDDGRNDKEFESLYTTFYNLKNACKLGIIGLKALEPSKLREFMPSGTAKYSQGKDFKFSNPNVKEKSNEDADAFNIRKQKAKDKYNNQIMTFQTFKTWIIAMLNNKKELNALAEQVAQALIDFEAKSLKSETSRGKATESRLSTDIKSSKTLREFIEKLTSLMAKYTEGAETFKKVKDTIIELPSDLFPLFITLIRFEYQFKKSI